METVVAARAVPMVQVLAPNEAEAAPVDGVAILMVVAVVDPRVETGVILVQGAAVVVTMVQAAIWVAVVAQVVSLPHPALRVPVVAGLGWVPK